MYRGAADFSAERRQFRDPSSPEAMSCDSGPSSGLEPVTPSFLFGAHRDKRRNMLASSTPNRQGKIVSFSPQISSISPRRVGSSFSITSSVHSESVDEVEDEIMQNTTVSRAAPRTPQASGGFSSLPPLRMLADSLKRPTIFDEKPRYEQPMEEDDDIAAAEEPQVLKEDECDFWVKVLGHRFDQVEDVVRIFGRHGEIVAYHVPDNGNWIWLRYATQIHVTQALNRNGRIIKDGTMIAVFPCSETELPDHVMASTGKGKENNTMNITNFNQSLIGTRNPEPPRRGDTSILEEVALAPLILLVCLCALECVH